MAHFFFFFNERFKQLTAGNKKKNYEESNSDIVIKDNSMIEDTETCPYSGHSKWHTATTESSGISSTGQS